VGQHRPYEKIFIHSFIAAFSLFIGSALIAQDTITVVTGLGTLETAIVEVSDSTMGVGNGLVIIGEETDGLPATIQVGVDGAGLSCS
jgi:hypothetical protein